MSDRRHSRSHALAYETAGMTPPPPVPLRRNDPERVGPYSLVSVLGSGAMGRVYLGRDTEGGPGPAAVKVVRPEYADDPLFRKRFAREVSALGRIRGAHTARLLGSGIEDELVWVATEYIPGPTLAEAVDERGPLDAEAAWRLTADLARAVEAVWREGIVHRDLKPSNVILAADGARVIDFGVVQATDGTSITATGQNVGTPAFMSPEQVRGMEVTAASDVFSLASTLVYAVTGTPPFGGGNGVDVLHRVAFDPPQEGILDRVTAVDPELAAFTRACLDKEPRSRPAPDEVFRMAIGHQLAAPATATPRPDGSAFATPAPSPEPSVSPGPVETPAPPRRRRALVGAAVVAVLVAGGVTAALLSPGGDPAEGAAPQVSGAVTGAVPPTDSASPGTDSASPAASGTPSQDGRAPESAASTKSPPNASVSDIRSGSCPQRLASGAADACVELLQKLLGGHGLYVPVDGSFGAATVAAVKAFQTAVGIDVDGAVGAVVKGLLYGASRGPVRSGAVTVTEGVNGVPTARCLSAGPDSASIEVWECAGAAAKQRWALYAIPGRAAQYLVVNQGTHLCLDADSAALGRNGQGVRGRTCDGLPAQRWKLGAAGADGGRTMISVPDGFCLDADAPTSGQDGQKVQAWACAGSANQVWTWS